MGRCETLSAKMRKAHTSFSIRFETTGDKFDAFGWKSSETHPPLGGFGPGANHGSNWTAFGDI